MTPPRDPLASFPSPAMASTFRIRSLSRHSSESLERLSFCCRTALVPLPRLAALAEELLLERQLLNPPSCPAWIRPEQLPF
ncbi:hypothetical protein KBY96_07730 [Cyanobium sp. ATX 6A2]|nr:hypothetical protein [Cyanobium sp. ATX 6A2]